MLLPAEASGMAHLPFLLAVIDTFGRLGYRTASFRSPQLTGVGGELVGEKEESKIEGRRRTHKTISSTHASGLQQNFILISVIGQPTKHIEAICQNGVSSLGDEGFRDKKQTTFSSNLDLQGKGGANERQFEVGHRKAFVIFSTGPLRPFASSTFERTSVDRFCPKRLK